MEAPPRTARRPELPEPCVAAEPFPAPGRLAKGSSSAREESRWALLAAEAAGVGAGAGDGARPTPLLPPLEAAPLAGDAVGVERFLMVAPPAWMSKAFAAPAVVRAANLLAPLGAGTLAPAPRRAPPFRVAPAARVRPRGTGVDVEPLLTRRVLPPPMTLTPPLPPVGAMPASPPPAAGGCPPAPCGGQPPPP